MRSSFVDKKLSDVAAFVSGAGYLWVASATTDMVFRVDPTTTDVQKFPLRQSADVLVFGDGSVWVLDRSTARSHESIPRRASWVHPSWPRAIFTGWRSGAGTYG